MRPSVGNQRSGISGRQVSKLRNPILGNAFFRLHLIERFGTGIPRTRKACRIFERQPRFEVCENSIRVTLPLANRELPISEDERKVYRELVGKSLQMSELTQTTGFGRTKVLSILKALIDKGHAPVSDTGRGTRYSAPR